MKAPAAGVVRSVGTFAYPPAHINHGLNSTAKEIFLRWFICSLGTGLDIVRSIKPTAKPVGGLGLARKGENQFFHSAYKFTMSICATDCESFRQQRKHQNTCTRKFPTVLKIEDAAKIPAAEDNTACLIYFGDRNESRDPSRRGPAAPLLLRSRRCFTSVTTAILPAIFSRFSSWRFRRIDCPFVRADGMDDVPTGSLGEKQSTKLLHL